MAEIDINAISAMLRYSSGASDYEGMITVPMSFEANLKTATKIYFPFKAKIVKLRGQATKAIAATDNGTVTGANATGSSTGGVLTFTASEAIDTEHSATPTTNNEVAADSYYQLTSAKTTSGGTCIVTIEYVRL